MTWSRRSRATSRGEAGFIVTGAAAYERFGGEFLGVKSVRVEEKKAYAIPGGDGAVSVYSPSWRLVEPTTGRAIAPLYRTPLLEEGPLEYPAAVVNAVGKGRVAYVPCDFFRFYIQEKAPLLRAFLNGVVAALGPDFAIQVDAPIAVDAVLRRKGGSSVIHLINRGQGQPGGWNSAGVEAVPPVGPVTVTMRLDRAPAKVYLAFEDAALEWTYEGGALTVSVPSVRMHSAVVVEQ